MMDDRIEDDGKEALGGLNSLPPHRKAHSYSHQHKHNRRARKHSLDDVRLSHSVESFYDSEDEDFFLNSSGAPADMDDQTPGTGTGTDIPLPEFIGAGGENGIFKPPRRAAVHPARPPCIELRPHPLRETQAGKFLRTIACTEEQLWAAQESGVRVWQLRNAFAPAPGLAGKVRRGDEDAAPFHESADSSPTLCLTVDNANKLIWSGHMDGKIRSWKMDQSFGAPFKEGLSWQAHRAPVLAMVITSFGKRFLFFPIITIGFGPHSPKQLSVQKNVM